MVAHPFVPTIVVDASAASAVAFGLVVVVFANEAIRMLGHQPMAASDQPR